MVKKNSCFAKLALLTIGQILRAVSLFLVQSSSIEVHVNSSCPTFEQFEVEFSPLYLIT